MNQPSLLGTFDPCALNPRRVEANQEWSLFCPNEAPGLAEVWGDEFEALYQKYEAEGRARKVVRAQQLWFAVLEAQIETGNPYVLFKVGGWCKDTCLTAVCAACAWQGACWHTYTSQLMQV